MGFASLAKTQAGCLSYVEQASCLFSPVADPSAQPTPLLFSFETFSPSHLRLVLLWTTAGEVLQVALGHLVGQALRLDVWVAEGGEVEGETLSYNGEGFMPSFDHDRIENREPIPEILSIFNLSFPPFSKYQWKCLTCAVVSQLALRGIWEFV